MEINVTITKVEITEIGTINQGEYNINNCQFTFTQDYNNLIKRAIFTTITNVSYLAEITDGKCNIPEEVLKYPGIVYLGVYAYENNSDGTLNLRYSPEPISFTINKGSYVENSKPIVPPEEVKDLMNQVTQLVIEIQQKIDDGDFNGEDGVGIANIIFNLDYTMTITLTNGNSYTSQIIRGENGYTPVKGIDYFTQTDIADIESDILNRIEALKKKIVQTLPLENIDNNIIYLVPKQNEIQGDMYDEYLYIDNVWEHIGSTQVDLTNYYTKIQIDLLLNSLHTYSTEETRIGTWLGKPLYRIVIPYSIAESWEIQQWVSILTLSDYDIKDIIDVKGFHINGDNPYSRRFLGKSTMSNDNEFSRAYYSTSTTGELTLTANKAPALSGYAIVEYTKTTD